MSEKPEINDDTVTMEPDLLDHLISQIATLASIYHKPPEAFVMKSISAATTAEDDEEGEGEEEGAGGHGWFLLCCLFVFRRVFSGALSPFCYRAT